MKKRILLIICIFVQIVALLPGQVNAGPVEDYREAQLQYLTAVASFASYPGADGDIATAIMRRDGWLTIPYVENDKTAQAKFLLAWKAGEGLPTEYMLAIAGTHNTEGIKLAFKAGKAYFAGRTLKEFADNADKKNDLPQQAPLVHRGFHQYVQTALATDVQPPTGDIAGRKLNELLLDHPDWKVYLTGHSAGGSAATLLAARLIDMGVKPNQLKIVTFAAPAVGNAAFAEKYSPALDLTRVVVAGDPIPDALQRIAGGFQQFGHEIRWKIDGYTFDEKHYPYIYLDCAVKNYYDKRLIAMKNGVAADLAPGEQPVQDGKRLYIAAINNNLPQNLNGEFPYMREVLLDQYRDAIPAYFIGEMNAKVPLTFDELRHKAAEAGCDRMVVVNIWGKKQDDPANYSGGLLTKADNTYDLIVIEQMVFQVADGELVDGRTYEKGSKYFTAIGALLSAAVAMGAESAAWSGQ